MAPLQKNQPVYEQGTELDANGKLTQAQNGGIIGETDNRMYSVQIVRGKSRAPYTGTPGHTYEQINDTGEIVSRSKYGSNGKIEWRDDLGGRPYFDKRTGKYLDKHRHEFQYNMHGQPTGETVIQIPEK